MKEKEGRKGGREKGKEEISKKKAELPPTEMSHTRSNVIGNSIQKILLKY